MRCSTAAPSGPWSRPTRRAPASSGASSAAMPSAWSRRIVALDCASATRTSSTVDPSERGSLVASTERSAPIATAPSANHGGRQPVT